MSNLSHTLVELEASKNKLLNDLDNAPIDSSKVAAGSLPRKDSVHRLREEVNMLRESLSRVESMNSERSQQVIDLSSQLRSLREEYAEFQSRYESDTRGLLDQYDRLKVEYVSVLETLSTYNAGLCMYPCILFFSRFVDMIYISFCVQLGYFPLSSLSLYSILSERE